MAMNKQAMSARRRNTRRGHLVNPLCPPGGCRISSPSRIMLDLQGMPTRYTALLFHPDKTGKRKEGALPPTRSRSVGIRAQKRHEGMKACLYVRALSPAEQAGIEAGLRSPDAFTLRRGLILLASSREQRPKEIARNLSCVTQTVRNAIHPFEQKGLECLKQESSRPKPYKCSLIRQNVKPYEPWCTRIPESLEKRPAFGPWRWRQRSALSKG